MTAIELTVADVWATGVTPDRHPVEFLRDQPLEEFALEIFNLNGFLYVR